MYIRVRGNKFDNLNVSILDMMVNSTSLKVGDRALIKEPFISKNSDNPAYYDTINVIYHISIYGFLRSCRIQYKVR
jgi:hypothetical protein